LIVSYNVETINGQIPLILEFQIRTHAMHFWASIEHSLKYKYQKNIPDNLKERLKSASLAAQKLDEEMSEIHKLIIELDDSNLSSIDPLENEISAMDLKKL
jgi:GTP pyrophosphokinase yjbM